MHFLASYRARISTKIKLLLIEKNTVSFLLAESTTYTQLLHQYIYP